MANFLKTHTPETIAGYVSELSRRLRHRLPPERATATLNEIEAHLTDRVEELTAQGMTREEAEARATKGFGRVGRFARRILYSAYEDKTARVARRVGFVFGAIALLLPARFNYVEFGYDSSSLILGCLWLVSPFIFLVCTILGRQPNPRGYMVLLAFSGISIFLLSGFSRISLIGVHNDPNTYHYTYSDLKHLIRYDRILVPTYQSEIALL